MTGASSGIGEETALHLDADGFAVYAAARRVDRMAPLADRGIAVLGMDVTDDASMVAGMDRILAEHGRIDVLVNNAGYGSYGAVEDVPLAEVRRQFEVNVFGMGRLVQLALPHMRAQRSGRIINVSSIGGQFYEPLGAWYHATKFAVEGFSDSLRIELMPFGVDVVIIEPGPVRSEWNRLSRESLTERSAGTAYAEQAERVSRTMARYDGRLRSSGPKPVARKILKAATATKPRARYPVGRGAGTLMMARKLLPDIAFDQVVRTMYRH